MGRRFLVAVVCAAALAGCGSASNDPPCGAPGCVSPCVPSCGGRQCGDDGCGGSCGSCAPGSACDVAGACAVLRCPSADQQCVVEEHTAYQYACDYQPPPGMTTCERLSVIGSYLSFDDCWTACAGGNSSCGDQHGAIDSEIAACLACTDSCVPGQTAVCPGDPAAACEAPCWCE